MKERSIILAAWEVQAILDGRKTQLRRLVKPQPSKDKGKAAWAVGEFPQVKNNIKSPFGQPGDKLWCKETWANTSNDDSMPVYYHANNQIENLQRDWRSPVTMPKWASRITLLVEKVWVQRVRDVSDKEIVAEGAIHRNGMGWAFTDTTKKWNCYSGTPHLAFQQKIWPGKIESWCWACEFGVEKRV